MTRGLDWLAEHQSRLGHWSATEGRYPTAMTALAGIALLCEGSTTTQGKYARQHPQGRRLPGQPQPHQRPDRRSAACDDRYTYGHGFSMLFLSQVLGEEEDVERREQLVDVLTKAVIFTGQAQTPAGGWGYVSAKDGGDFDEGSTTITQVQGLRGCRNAGIPVPKEIIDKAVKYIRDCTRPDGGVQYNSRRRRRRGRPSSPAAIACLFNAGDYDDKYVPKLLAYCHRGIWTTFPRTTSATGIMPITTIPRCCTAKGARPGSTIATRSTAAPRPKPTRTAPGTRAIWARSTRRP